MTSTVNTVQRGQAITARGHNELVNAVNTLATVDLRLLQQALGIITQFELLVITNIELSRGRVTCERIVPTPTTPEALPVQLWPALYDISNYTYTDNNTRTHTASSTTQVLTPPLKVGEWLACHWFEHPETPDGLGGIEPFLGFIDTNRVARMWAEVPGA